MCGRHHEAEDLSGLREGLRLKGPRATYTYEEVIRREETNNLSIMDFWEVADKSRETKHKQDWGVGYFWVHHYVPLYAIEKDNYSTFL